MQNRLLAATALSTTIAFLVPASAFAQAAPYNWTGFYTGFTFGGMESRSTLDTTYGGTYTVPSHIDLPRLGPSASVVGGYNIQNGQYVYGVEGDFGILPLEGTTTTPNYTVEDKLNALLTLRGRFGIAQDRLLVYGTAGIAAGQASFTSDIGKGSSGTYAQASGSGTVVGPVVGVGMEYALTDKLSAKLEGKVFDLGTISGVGDTGKGAGGAPDPYTATYHPRGAILSTGLNLHF